MSMGVLMRSANDFNHGLFLFNHRQKMGVLNVTMKMRILMMTKMMMTGIMLIMSMR